MYQTIGEGIAVLGSYRAGHFKPLRFAWRQRTYHIEEITLVSESRNGGVRGRTYSVLVKGTVYRLFFNRDTEEWRLEEVWCE